MKLKLWVTNQVGVDFDATKYYIDRTGWTPPDGVTRDREYLIGDDCQKLWRAYRDLAQKIRYCGHGEYEHKQPDDNFPAPLLSAIPSEIERTGSDSDKSLCEIISTEKETWEDFCSAMRWTPPDNTTISYEHPYHDIRIRVWDDGSGACLEFMPELQKKIKTADGSWYGIDDIPIDGEVIKAGGKLYKVDERDSPDPPSLYEVQEEPDCGLWWDADSDHIEVQDDGSWWD